jgi:hypothetical protein
MLRHEVHVWEGLLSKLYSTRILQKKNRRFLSTQICADLKLTEYLRNVTKIFPIKLDEKSNSMASFPISAHQQEDQPSD